MNTVVHSTSRKDALVASIAHYKRCLEVSFGCLLIGSSWESLDFPIWRITSTTVGGIASVGATIIALDAMAKIPKVERKFNR